MIGTLFVMAQLIVSAHPPLSPADALAVLRASHSPANWTDVPHPVETDGPQIVVFDASRPITPSTEAQIASPPRYLLDMQAANAAALWQARMARGSRVSGDRSREAPSHGRGRR